ncbi:MAG: metallophosphoesterase [Clostridia bacterium]|nr:metallophosphoesterase [Clostridia bacterium]
MKYEILKKYYSTEDKKFHIIVYDKHTDQEKNISFLKFSKFYKAINKNLDEANLLGYDFDDFNPRKCDLSNAKISSKTMMKLGIYDSKIFESLESQKELAEIQQLETKELASVREDVFVDEKCAIIYYISDLHINHKLLDKFKEQVNKYEIEEYIESLVLKMKRSRSSSTKCTAEKIIIIGDVSFNFEVFKLFFKIYRKVMPYVDTFFVVGNHELWDDELFARTKTIDQMICQMREYLSSLNCPIILLENQLYFGNSRKLWDENDILNASEYEWETIWQQNSYAIFGGLGYAGHSEEFNCTHGIYRKALINREEEIIRSRRVADIHEKLKIVAKNKQIVFVTHTPKYDWTDSDYVEGWIYLSGHTHKNCFIESEGKRVYADNQIGYKNKSFGLKFVNISNTYNIFSDYEDGIYELSREEYKAFYRGIGEGVTFNRQFEKLYLVKRNGNFMFFMRAGKGNNALKLLDGGNVKNVGKTLEYFYEKLSNYSASITMFLEDYQNSLENISKEIKFIGGEGRIHGCIVDVDFFNHIFVNPLDGTITCYYASSMTRKFVYKNFTSLLKFSVPKLYESYKFLEKTKTENKVSIVAKNNTNESPETIFVENTEMYRVSKIIKSLQYATKHNVVRLWNETLTDFVSVENGKRIVENILLSPPK